MKLQSEFVQCKSFIMNKINLCLENSLNSATGKLQPVILKAILDLLKNDVHIHTVRLIKTKCLELKSDVNWDGRLPAICNAMRNAIKCGGKIISEDRDFLDFTIEFENDAIEGKFNLIDKTIIQDKKQNIKRKNNNLQKLKTDSIEIIDEKIKDLIDFLNQEKVKDKNRKKLLIIGCSDAKNTGGNELNYQNYFQVDNYNNLLENRTFRLNQYDDLLENQPNYFLFKKRNNIEVEPDYFANCRNNGGYLPAYLRYNGRYYSYDLRELYLEKSIDSNLHILIISGLYGVLEFRDSIMDYHIKMNKKSFWTKNTDIKDSISNYIEENKIEEDMVFYSLSKEYLSVLHANPEWRDLWIIGGGNSRSANLIYSAKCLRVFLQNL